MKIKHLELKGFKSFKNRTVIGFDKGINCVVGPNGCGKSNIIDAFLWVMGETAPSHLRGDSMEDVIFTGTDSISESGRAEVSLLLEKSDQNNFPPLYKHLSEVMITRRLDRDGKSEYLINSNACRLRDIQEFFMDTGVGVHGFSFIEQGAVGEFLSSKPSQKRLLIESVAGISKFRIKKREAQRKLELTQVNLKRLEDVLSQQRKQLGKLKKQTEKAEKFVDLKKHIQEKDIQISVRSLANLQKQIKALDPPIETEQTKKEKTQKDIDFSSNSVTLNQEYNDIKEKAETVQRERTQVREELLSVEKQLASSHAFLTVNTDTDVQLKEDVQLSEKNRKNILSTLEENQAQILKLTEQVKISQKKREAIQGNYTRLSESFLAIELKKESLEKELTYLHQQDMTSKESTQAVTEKIDYLEKNTNTLNNDLKKKVSELQATRLSSSRLTKTLDKEEQQSFSLLDSVQVMKTEKESLSKEVQDVDARLQQKRQQAMSLYSEMNSLKKLGSRMDSLENGTQFVLNSKQSLGTALISTSDSLRTRYSELEKSISYLIGYRLKSLFCSSASVALLFVDILKTQQAGQCRFILKDYQESTSDQSKMLLKEENGFKFFLSDKLEGDSELIEALFSKTAVVGTVTQALQLKKSYPSWAFVTLGGEVLTQEGDLIGGENSEEEINILEYKRLIKEVPVQYKKIQTEVTVLESQREKLQGILQKVIKKLEDSMNQDGNYKMRVLELSKDRESLLRDQSRLQLEISEIQQKLQECQNQKQQLQSKKEALDKEDSSHKKAALNLTLQSTEGDYKKTDQEKRGLYTQKEDLEKQIASISNQTEYLKEKRALIQQSLDQERVREQGLVSRAEKKKFLAKNYENDVEKLNKQQESLTQKVSAKELEFIERNTKCQELKETIDKKQLHTIELHKKLTEQMAALNKWKLEKVNISLKGSTLIEKIQERYQVDLVSLMKETQEGVEEEKSFDHTEAEQELAHLNKAFYRIGDVNLLALSEYSSLEKETIFYQKQYDDLRVSNEKLNEVIKRIDSFCSKKFHTVFEQVDSRFSKIFPSIFEGGKANLILVKGDSIGEEGIDIMVQPPAKKIQNMNLLSGGEKAMAAVALLFSIFLVKSSPFCILDEVDAPLDDANIIRFHSLLSEISAISQVILITHNKHTMRGCDRLYGVTMEEKGISKCLSLNMKKTNKSESATNMKL